MTYITVMASLHKSEDTILEAYRLNSSQILSIRDLGNYFVCISDGGVIRRFESPIAEIQMPGMTFYASGVADELLARVR